MFDNLFINPPSDSFQSSDISIIVCIVFLVIVHKCNSPANVSRSSNQLQAALVYSFQDWESQEFKKPGDVRRAHGHAYTKLHAFIPESKPVQLHGGDTIQETQDACYPINS